MSINMEALRHLKLEFYTDEVPQIVSFINQVQFEH